jgi:hypothetical protein
VRVVHPICTLVRNNFGKLTWSSRAYATKTVRQWRCAKCSTFTVASEALPADWARAYLTCSYWEILGDYCHLALYVVGLQLRR